MDVIKQSTKGTLRDSDALKFLDNLYQAIVADLIKGTDPCTKVTDYVPLEDLKKLFDLKITHDGVNGVSLLEDCAKIMRFSVKTQHPRFFNQLYSGRDVYGLAGAFLAQALNTNPHIYLVAPVLVLIENFVIETVGNLIGYKEPDGIFVPGSSLGTMMAMNVARFKINEDVKRVGTSGMPVFQAFVSEDGHYSVKKSAALLGVGTDNAVLVKTDHMGRMRPDDLEAKIVESKGRGHLPFFVTATAGTTVLGAFDDLNAVADVCQKYGIWLHIDAAWGGAALFSKKHKLLLSGLERANSVVLCFNKLLGTPIQSSAIFLQEKGLLEKCNSEDASYLFEESKEGEICPDPGNKTVQCSRTPDSLKFWLTWRSRGHDGMDEHVTTVIQLAQYFVEETRKRKSSFLLVLPEFSYVNISFWFVPPSLRRNEDRSSDWWSKLGKVAPIIKGRMVAAGTMLINCQPLESKGLASFFRIIIDNPLTTTKDLDFVLDEFERLGADL